MKIISLIFQTLYKIRKKTIDQEFNFIVKPKLWLFIYKIHHNLLRLEFYQKNIIILQSKLLKINIVIKSLFNLLFLNFKFFNNWLLKFLKNVSIKL